MGYTGRNCDQCSIAYYGDGTTCTSCGDKRTTPSGGARTASDCKYYE